MDDPIFVFRYHQMMYCWSASPEERPSFADLKQFFGRCLEQLLEGRNNDVSQAHRRDGQYAPVRSRYAHDLPPTRGFLEQELNSDDVEQDSTGTEDGYEVPKTSRLRETRVDDGHELPTSSRPPKAMRVDPVAKLWRKEKASMTW